MELRSPIRLYWDVTPLPVPLPDYDRICAQIASSRALTLHLTDLGDAPSAETKRILRHLSTSTLVLTLTISSTGADDAGSLLASGIRKLYVDLPSPGAIRDYAGSGISGVSFRTTRDNHTLLPEIISACLESGIKELQLPMERLIAHEEPLCLSTDQQERLAARISHIPFPGRLDVTANDPFLWRVVHPGTPFPDGVCQAANTMLAVAPNGDLYPCPAMPVLLGNLQRAAFSEIVASPVKKEVRSRIFARPAGCIGCRLLDDCRGGCRGRGYFAGQDLNSGDPGCGIS